MLLTCLPPAGVYAPIWPLENAVALLQVIAELSLVSLARGEHVAAEAFHLIGLPAACVGATVRPLVASMSMYCLFIEVSLVHA